MASAGDINKECRESQENELEALESVYGDTIFSRASHDGRLGAIIKINTRLPKDHLTVRLEIPVASKTQSQVFQVEHLPPIILEVDFPAGYPEREAPRFLVSTQWLTPTDLGKVSKRLDEIWSELEGMIVVYTWADFLENELLNFLGVSDTLDLRKVFCVQTRLHASLRKRSKKKVTPKKNRNKKKSRVRMIPVQGKELAPLLISHNEMMRREEFLKSVVECMICFSSYAGKEMALFSPCWHAFCNDCTKQHLETQLSEGLPNGAVTCMFPKCDSEIQDSEVKRLLGENQFEKYDEYLLQRYLNSEDDIIPCGRKACGSPVVIDLHSTIAICPDCRYSFCRMCRDASHGVNPCSLKLEGKRDLLEKYMRASPSARAKMEKTYSKKYLASLVEELQSAEYLAKHSMKCPKCQTDIQKSDGCNKMSCQKCGTNFCYLCGNNLNGFANPYDHFLQKGNACYARLMEGVNGDQPLEHVGDNEDDDEDDDMFDDDLMEMIWGNQEWEEDVDFDGLDFNDPDMFLD